MYPPQAWRVFDLQSPPNKPEQDLQRIAQSLDYQTLSLSPPPPRAASGPVPGACPSGIGIIGSTTDGPPCSSPRAPSGGGGGS